ncbi:MAG: hypothetical protein MMC33_003484 [Icmadophila ericetorum]|nr:hypothetical protein [Icmadophila ericetorum]
MAGKVDYTALRAQTLGTGNDEEAVTVNTRALIDKVLARYSGEWTVLRELLQNAADANATKVTIKFETLPSSSVPLPQPATGSNLLKHTLLYHTLKRLIVTNDGQPFGSNDWSRLKRIAEGNPDETKIGAFGVGFYSVFADCEEPFVSSGRQAMAFYWKGNSLFTKLLQLSEEQATKETSFVLDYRNSTSPVPPLLPLSQFLASSLTFIGLTSVELWLDDWNLLTIGKISAPSSDISIPRSLETKSSEGFMKVSSVVRQMAQLDAEWLNIVAWKPKAPSNSVLGNVSVTTVREATSHQGLRTFFQRFTANAPPPAVVKAANQERAAQEAIADDLLGESKATVFLHINTATIQTSCSTSFSQELERATKKPPPKTTKLAVLTSSFDEIAASTSSVTAPASKMADIFGSVLPSKSGRIYIGFPTHQTTGLKAHISAPSLIPTVERESIDLNARWVKTWNMEMLRIAGIVCRVAWSSENDSIKDKLSKALARDKVTKFAKEHIDAIIPEAVHALNQFTFLESTPSSQVGSLVEEAFWTCSKIASIDILSSRGVLPSQDVRIAVDDLTFIKNIPVLPAAMVAHASSFVQKLTDFGIITEVTPTDIKKALKDQALDAKQLAEFLHWLAHKAKINEVDSAMVKNLLDVTVASEYGDDGHGKLIVLSEIKHFINPSRISGNMPVPPNTMPFKYTQKFDRTDLEALGWEDLMIVPWLRWLVENTNGRGALSIDQDLTKSLEFARQVLPVLSKQWDGLSQSSKTTVVDLLSTRTVIPTRVGMRKPNESYFSTVKIFDDLPVVIGLNSVKDKFLVALGVRKTIELGLIFDRLMRPPEYSSDASAPIPAWSHVDLIKYLASVRNDIPPTDLKRLRDTPLCPDEASDLTKGNVQRYLIRDLLEPKDPLRTLGLRILQWSGIYRPESEEGRFLTFLGLKKFPSVSELVNVMISAGNSQLGDRALKYFIDSYHKNNYASTASTCSNQPYLPLQGDTTGRRVAPNQCYSSDGATLMGYDILRKDLHPHADKFGVRKDPQIDDCVDRLLMNPPDSKRQARELFAYFASRINELNTRLTEVIGKAEIVPVPPKSGPPSEKSEKTSTVRRIAPRASFLGNGGKYAEIFDYADFGDEANIFLLRCGSKHEPSVAELARLVVREPARVYDTLQSVEKYTELLSSLAESWSTLKNDKALVQVMKTSSFLLAYKEYPAVKRQSKNQDLVELNDEEDESTVKTWRLAAAKDIIIVDDLISYNLFRSSLLAAPMEEKIEDFYDVLGSNLLSTLVEERAQCGTIDHDQTGAAKLEKLILERIQLFLYDSPREHVRHNSKWLEENLKFVSVKTLSLKKSLKGMNVSHTTPRTAATVWDRPQKNWVLYFTNSRYDNFEISQAILPLILSRPKPQQAIMLDVLLSTDLHKLKQRGYNVDRILRRRAAEARIAEEERKKQLEAEQQRIKEEQAANAESRKQQQREQRELERISSIPGGFPDSPNKHNQRISEDYQDRNGSMAERPRGGIFSELTRRFGIDRRPQDLSNGDADEPAPPPYREGEVEQHTPEKPITAPHQLQQNLLNAVQSARAHNSQSLVTRPTINEVNETQSYCDSTPAANIRHHGDTISNVKIYLSNTLTNPGKFMAENASALNMFASVLLDCASAFNLSTASIHIFHEANSSTIAFNQNGALFFNYLYFENLHLPAVQQGKTGDAVVYWFVVFCHELAHNLVKDHSAAHSYYAESFVVQYFTAITTRVAQRGGAAGAVGAVGAAAGGPSSSSASGSSTSTSALVSASAGLASPASPTTTAHNRLRHPFLNGHGHLLG